MPFPDIDLCRSGYSRNLTGEPLQTSFDGHTRTRRKTRKRWVTDTACWICTEQQCAELEHFHRQAGGDWFELDLPDWQGLTTTVASFATPLSITPMQTDYQVTASLTVPQPSIMDNETLSEKLLEMIGVTDGTFNDALNEFVHIDWPAFWESKS